MIYVKPGPVEPDRKLAMFSTLKHQQFNVFQGDVQPPVTGPEVLSYFCYVHDPTRCYRMFPGGGDISANPTLIIALSTRRGKVEVGWHIFDRNGSAWLILT